MKVKRYIGNDLSEAMIRVKNELGRDAVILHTRKIKKKGLAGLFGAKLVEVVAAVDEPDAPMMPTRSHEKEVQEALEAIRQISGAAKPVREPVVQPSQADDESKLSGEVNELKKMVMEMMNRLEKPEAKTHEKKHVNVERVAEPEPVYLNERPVSREVVELFEPEPVRVEESIQNSGKIERIKAQLRDKEIDDSVIDALLNKVDSRTMNYEPSYAIESAIREMMGEPYTIGSGNEGQKVFMFVGPTGVGKTTTLAKLAARLSLVENKSVGLITADTFRIAAVEQLKTYSEILGIPLTVIYEPEEIREALGSYRDKDFVLVDTAGRSHKSEELRDDLDSLMRHLKKPEIFLVVSLTTGYRDIVSILDSYEFLKDFKLLFTKLDEASSLGNILNIKAQTGKPLSYFAIGQSVPDDIEVANADRIVNFIVGE